METKLLNVTEVAERFGVKKDTIYLWVRTKALPHIKLGGRIIRFESSAINNWIAAQTQEVTNA